MYCHLYCVSKNMLPSCRPIYMLVVLKYLMLEVILILQGR